MRFLKLLLSVFGLILKIIVFNIYLAEITEIFLWYHIVTLLFAAIRVAGKMQKEVTEKRGTIDSLQTRINWLEECLEVALKVC